MRGPGLGHGLHGHDLRHGVDRSAVGLARTAQLFATGRGIDGDGGEVELARAVGILAQRGHGNRRLLGQRTGLTREEGRDLQAREPTVEDLQLVYFTAREAPVAEALADGEGPLSAALDRARQLVAHDLALDAPAVDEERQASGPGGAVVGQRDVRPLPDLERLEGPDAQRVARPEVDQRGREPAILEQELVAAAARVGPGPRAVEDHGALVVHDRTHPERDRERVVAMEGADAREGRAAIAAQA